MVGGHDACGLLCYADSCAGALDPEELPYEVVEPGSLMPLLLGPEDAQV